MANLIILEGVSRTGKSSLTKSLSEKFGFRNISIKNKMPESIDNLPDFYQGMHMMANEFFAAFPDETFILDRSFISELVYSKTFSRKTYINEDEVIADLLHDNNFVIVNLSTIHAEYLKRAPKDKRIYSLYEFNLQKDTFYWFFEYFKCYYSGKKWQNRFLELDTNSFTIEQCAEQIECLLNKNSILKKQNT
jgi:thymidylate kinase